VVGLDHEGVPAVPFIGVRYLLASVFYIPWLVLALRRWSGKDLAFGALCGLIGIAGYNLPNVLGSRTVSAGMTGLLNGAEPLMIVILGALYHRRTPRALAWVAGLIGLAGVVLLAAGAGPALGDVRGITLTLFAALAWSVYCVIVPPLIARRGIFEVTAVAVVAGMLPMMAASVPELHAFVAVMTPAEWGILVALAAFTSFAAMLLWNFGATGLGAEQAGYFLYLLPVVSLGGGVAVLGEPVTFIEFAGGALIMVSVLLSQRAK
jgi:drug/metabolite transporter (DMT)-like permease